jgi:hypothetical protein
MHLFSIFTPLCYATFSFFVYRYQLKKLYLVLLQRQERLGLYKNIDSFSVGIFVSSVETFEISITVKPLDGITLGLTKSISINRMKKITN